VRISTKRATQPQSPLKFPLKLSSDFQPLKDK